MSNFKLILPHVGSYGLVVSWYDGQPLICSWPLWNGWRKKRSSAIWRIISAIGMLQQKHYRQRKFKYFLDISFMKHTCIYTSISYITDSGSFDNITNNKFLDCLVFGHAASAIGATHRLDVTTTMFWSSSITALASL